MHVDIRLSSVKVGGTESGPSDFTMRPELFPPFLMAYRVERVLLGRQ